LCLPQPRNNLKTTLEQTMKQQVNPQRYDKFKVAKTHDVILSAVLQAKRDLGPKDDSHAVLVSLVNLVCDECRFDTSIEPEGLLTAMHTNIVQARILDKEHAARSKT
jgi:hypothetical protein